MAKRKKKVTKRKRAKRGAYKSPEDRRSVAIRVMATAEQAQALREAAEATGMSLSTWALHALLEAAENA